MNRLAQILASFAPIGLAAGGLMWVIWAISSMLGPGNLDVNEQVIGTDHTAFHTAAVLVDEGQGSALFDYPDLPVFRARQEEITGKRGFLDPFRNPPFVALAYLPTARLPYLVSYAVWAIAGLIALALAVYLIRGPRLWKPLGWSLSFYPVFATVSFGQNTLLSLGVLGVVCRLLVDDRRFLAGVAAGVLLYKPQLLLGLGIWWLLDVRQFWRCLAGLAATGSVLALCSWLCVPDETRAWFQNLGAIARYDAFNFYNLHNPRGFGTLLTDNKSFGNWFGFAGLAIGIIWLIRFWRRHGGDRKLMFAAAVLTTLWASPHTMTYEWGLAVIPALLLWDRRPDLRDTWLPMFAVAWAVLFISTPLTKMQLSLTGYAVQLSVPAIAAIGMWLDRELARKES